MALAPGFEPRPRWWEGRKIKIESQHIQIVEY